MMSYITRTVNGVSYEFELTEQEEWGVYRKILKQNMRDDILNVLEVREIRDLTEDEMEDVLEYYMDHAGEAGYEDVVMWALDYCGINAEEEE